MASKNSMTFNASIRLNSAQFKKGVAEVKSAIAGLKSSFLSLAGALGAGLGFSQFIGNLKDTAVQLSVAKSTLENVSKTTKTFETQLGSINVEVSNYGENLEFVKRLSREYSQDLVSLTENFAQFHAACEGTNLSLENQKIVFESLTRAAAYYHMSADRSKDMMTAITQMMSKGKVSAEELRRQLGNALPGAFNLMAAAMGVSTAELEDMMKKGQVISSEVLPKFAAMLNQVTKNANFDSLQMSMNQLRNTWYDLVDNSGAESLFKKIIDGANKVLSSISNNINILKSSLKGVTAGILAFTGFKYLINEGNKYIAEAENQLTKLQKIQETKLAKIFGSKDGKNAIGFNAGQPITKLFQGNAGGKFGNTQMLSEDELRAIKEYNETLIDIAKIRKTQLLPTMAKERQEQNAIIAAAKKTNKEIAKQIGEVKTVTVATKALKGVWAGISSITKNILQFLKANAIVAIASAILGIFSAIQDYFKNIKEETKRIGEIFSNYESEMGEIQSQTDATNRKLEAQLDIAQDLNAELPKRKKALEDINKTLGLTGDNAFGLDALDKTKQAYKDIVNVVQQWIKASTTLAKVQAHAAAGAQAEADIIRLNAQIEAKRLRLREISVGKGSDENGDTVFGPKSLWYRPEYNRLNKEIELANKEIAELGKVSKNSQQIVDQLYNEYYGLISGTTQSNNNNNNVETELSKVMDKFTKEKKELEHKLREHAITQEEYNEELRKLVQKYWEEAAGTGQMSIDKILSKMDKGKTLTKMEQWYKDLYDAAQEAAFEATINAAADAIEKATEDAIEEADKKLKEDLDESIEKMEKVLQANIDSLLTDKPGKTQRDKTFDYKKTASDIQSEELDIHNDYVNELEESINTIISKYDNLEDAAEAVRNKIAEWKGELNLAKKEAATLEEAMKLAKIQEDIDNLDKSIRDTVYGGIKNMASSMDRVVKGVESIKTTFEDSDSTGWEKFIVVFNELTQIIDTIISAYQTVQAVQEATNKMNEAEISLEATKIALLEKELLLRQALAAEKGLETKNTEELAAANMAEAASANISSSAKASDAIAGATASGAKLPFPYNIAAIAAGVAAVLAALAGMKKFAHGGFVTGPRFGDRNVVAANGGEYIMTTAQQKRLLDIVDGKGNVGRSGGGQVEFKIRGADLVGTINNYNRIKKG